MVMIDDYDARHCYEATVWNLVLGNDLLRRLVMGRACNLFRLTISHFERVNRCELRKGGNSDRFSDGLVTAAYDRYVNELGLPELEYAKNNGGLPTCLLRAILEQHDSDKEPLTEQDVLLDVHGREHTEESLGWTYQHLMDSLLKDAKRHGDAYVYAGSVVNVLLMKRYQHTIALVSRQLTTVHGTARLYQCDTTMKNRYHRISDYCIDVTNDVELLGWTPQGTDTEPYTITSATHVFVHRDRANATPTCYEHPTAVTFRWRNRVFVHDFLTAPRITMRSLRRALPGADINRKDYDAFMKHFEQHLHDSDLRDHFHDTTHYRVFVRIRNKTSELYVLRDDPQLLHKVAYIVRKFYRAVYGVKSEALLRLGVPYTMEKIRKEVGVDRDAYDDVSGLNTLRLLDNDRGEADIFFLDAQQLEQQRARKTRVTSQRASREKRRERLEAERRRRDQTRAR